MSIAGFLAVLLLALAGYDLVQRRHAVLRNFPVVGHLRYLLESIGPELRQYIVAGNGEERPFSRNQRRWIYASSKKENNNFAFGTERDLEGSPGVGVLRHAPFPVPEPDPPDPLHRIECAKVLGAARGRRLAFRPKSIINISGMSFGSLSAPAVVALNRGAALAHCWQNTGEGGISPHHLEGGDLVWQIGTGYFGCRDEAGRFDLERLKNTLAGAPTVRALEIKLSQGAKPGLGGMLPAAKVTPEIAAIRGVAAGRDCVSPPNHSAFRDADSLLDFVELLAEETGLPVGIKSAVGQMEFWDDLTRLMARGDRGIDLLTVDGSEGGTGAAPLAFVDHIALPFKLAMSRVYRTFAERGLQDRVVFNGSGKLGFPSAALTAFALGCDVIGVAREAMLSIGCIQAQQCHSGRCPAGIATQSRWLMRGLDPTLKSARAANYICCLRKEIDWLTRACGLSHPSQIRGNHIEILDERFGSRTLDEAFGYEPHWRSPAGAGLDASPAAPSLTPLADRSADPEIVARDPWGTQLRLRVSDDAGREG